MFILLLFSFTLACNPNTFSACYEKFRDSVKCIKSSECVENYLELKLYTSRVYIQGFKVFDNFQDIVQELIGCDLEEYENCFKYSDSKTITCLIGINCLEFTEIDELILDIPNPSNGNVNGDGVIYYQNINPNPNSIGDENNKDHHNQKSEENTNHGNIDQFNQNLYKDETGINKSTADQNEDSIGIDKMSLESIASLISEIYDQWEIAKEAQGADRSKYKNFYDAEGNIIDIDVKLEALYNAYRRKIHERMEVQRSQPKPFEDLSTETQEHPNLVPPKVTPVSTYSQLDSFDDNLKQTDSEIAIPVKSKSDPTASNTRTHKSADQSKETSDQDQNEFENLWHKPGATANNLNKVEKEEIKQEDEFEEFNEKDLENNQNDESLDAADGNQPDDEDSEFQPKIRDEREDENEDEGEDGGLAQEDKIESDGINEEIAEVPEDKTTGFLQENTCEEKCSLQCKTSEDTETCTSQCIYNTCSTSKPVTSDYITVILTGMFLFIVVFVIYIFIKSRGSRQVYDSYIKGHSA